VAWKVEKGVAKVQLPAGGVYDFKLVVRKAGWRGVWEDGDNRFPGGRGGRRALASKGCLEREALGPKQDERRWEEDMLKRAAWLMALL